MKLRIMTVSKMTLSIMTFSRMGLIVTFSIKTLSIMILNNTNELDCVTQYKKHIV